MFCKRRSAQGHSNHPNCIMRRLWFFRNVATFSHEWRTHTLPRGSTGASGECGQQPGRSLKNGSRKSLIYAFICGGNAWDLSFSVSLMIWDTGDSFCDPNPHIQGKNMNKNLAPKLPNLPCFEAFGAIFFVQMFVHTFALYVGGGGHQRISETRL